ncbi:Amidohydrolase [Alloalcanivorax dieselolei B5]|uniref:Amidohydrolase n=1 Tax=Alcanivorax dieselolei (strain DSM 16502 / CGMCC 1.3690 / MCCC 1A00001 / B-5) TaxID=930169 RepID=K0CKC5_ALCDB|nr:amidohydrolase family protein [Alloalcanivorax dieselolei]AFT72192.1 Amidohydrolase [Alloalcanivorax dieselolei B5]GGJ75975.1 dihydroorotase [Alloalcanivorax dieselolei]
MNTLTHPDRFDLIIENGELLDPATGMRQSGHLAIHNGRISAISPTAFTIPARHRVNATGKLVCPGLIDMHVHVYEWVTNFGVQADDAGVHAGITTVVDQGSSGAWTFGGFNAHVIEPSLTDVRAFVSINVAGALMGGMKGEVLHNPSMTDGASLIALAQRYPDHVKGIKCHCESGGLSHWGTDVLQHASEVGRAANIPLYVHTGELFPVKESSRPEVGSVFTSVLPLLKPGDMLAHIYSCMPDGIVGQSKEVPAAVIEAKDMGVHFDIGYGLNFSYRIARMLMEADLLPFTISSDIHGDFNRFHDNSKLDYSLYGAMTRLWALGMSLEDVIQATTYNPARMLKEEDEIGTLAIGSRADLSIIEIDESGYDLADGRGEWLHTPKALLPWMTIREGRRITPHRRLIKDLIPQTTTAL